MESTGHENYTIETLQSLYRGQLGRLSRARTEASKAAAQKQANVWLAEIQSRGESA